MNINSVKNSQLPFSYADTTTEVSQIHINDNKESETIKPATSVNQPPPTIIVVQQPAPQSYLPNPYYGNGYQVIEQENGCLRIYNPPGSIK